MPSAELTHVFPVAAPPAAVFAHLVEPESYIGLSPLVVAVRDVRRTDEVVHYSAVERFRFLRVLQHDNVIKVSLVPAGDRLPHSAVVTGDVLSPGGVRMSYRFTIVSCTDGSLVTDSLQLHTPLGLLHYVASQARRVQAARARVLAQRMG